jgi:hypothetical protein
MKILLAAALSILLTACASKPTVAVQRPAIARIAVVAATDPTWYAFDNVNALQYLVPISALGFHLDSKGKARVFNETMAAAPAPIGAALTQVVVDGLRAQGYEVDVLDVRRTPDDPDSVEHESLVTSADAVLHLHFGQVGLHSPRSATDYLPRINARAMLFYPGKEPAYIHDAEVFYGVDARNGTSWSIAADKRWAFPSYDAVLTRMPEVKEMFLEAADLLGRRTSAQVHASIQATRPAPRP